MPFFGALSTAWNHVCSQVAHRQIQMGLCARADRLDRGPGRARVYWTRARAKGHECGTLIDTPEVQRAMVEAAASRAASDSDHRGPDQLAVEYRQHALPVFLVEGAQSVIQKNPARLVSRTAPDGRRSSPAMRRSSSPKSPKIRSAAASVTSPAGVGA
jgi:hypothetical protein